MERGDSSSGNRPDRKTIEKNRRILMKNLCFKLVSLVPDHHFSPPKEFLSQQDQIEQVGAYIKIFRERIEELRRKKTQALTNRDATNYGPSNDAIMCEAMRPVLEIKDLGEAVVVVLITGPTKSFMVHQIIRIIEEEGAQVVTINISTSGDRIFHNLHAQVKVPRVGVDTSRISERIEELIA